MPNLSYNVIIVILMLLLPTLNTDQVVHFNCLYLPLKEQPHPQPPIIPLSQALCLTGTDNHSKLETGILTVIADYPLDQIFEIAVTSQIHVQIFSHEQQKGFLPMTNASQMLSLQLTHEQMRQHEQLFIHYNANEQPHLCVAVRVVPYDGAASNLKFRPLTLNRTEIITLGELKESSLTIINPRFVRDAEVIRYQGHPYLASYICHRQTLTACLHYALSKKLTVSDFDHKYPQYIHYINQKHRQANESNTHDTLHELQNKYEYIPHLPQRLLNRHEKLAFQYCSNCIVLLLVYCQWECELEIRPLSQSYSQININQPIIVSKSIKHTLTHIKLEDSNSYNVLIGFVEDGYFEQFVYDRFSGHMKIGVDFSNSRIIASSWLSYVCIIGMDRGDGLTYSFRLAEGLKVPIYPIVYTFQMRGMSRLVMHLATITHLAISCQSYNHTLYRSQKIGIVTVILPAYSRQGNRCSIRFPFMLSATPQPVSMLTLYKSPIITLNPSSWTPLRIDSSQPPTIIAIPNSQHPITLHIERCNRGAITLRYYNQNRFWNIKQHRISTPRIWSHTVSNKHDNLIVEIVADSYSYIQLQYSLATQSVNQLPNYIQVDSSTFSKVNATHIFFNITLQNCKGINSNTLKLFSTQDYHLLDLLQAHAWCPGTAFVSYQLDEHRAYYRSLEQLQSVAVKMINVQSHRICVVGYLNGQSRYLALVLKGQQAIHTVDLSSKMIVSQEHYFIAVILVVICGLLATVVINLYREPSGTNSHNNSNKLLWKIS